MSISMNKPVMPRPVVKTAAAMPVQAAPSAAPTVPVAVKSPVTLQQVLTVKSKANHEDLLGKLGLAGGFSGLIAGAAACIWSPFIGVPAMVAGLGGIVFGAIKSNQASNENDQAKIMQAAMTSYNANTNYNIRAGN